ncbi:MAG: N-acetyltransferase [Planctomycetota bacterium]|nr:N-acetyltransferase [Planctomycetota bacterium]
MAKFEVVPAEGKLLKKFLRLPWKIYAKDANWVPPLLGTLKPFFTGVHPFLQHGEILPYVALNQRGVCVGRIAAVINQNHTRIHNDRTGFFGFFECVDDAEVAGALLAQAAEAVRKRGCLSIIGPSSPTTNDECAMLVDGFDSPPTFMMPYNPPYYSRLLEASGFAKVKDIVSYIIYDTTQLPPKLFKVAEMARKKAELTIRPVKMSRLQEELLKVKEIYNAAWEKNWGFVPMTEAEIDYMAKELKKILRPELVLIAEGQSEPAGFSLTVPDIYQALIYVRSGKLFPFGFLKFLLNQKKIRRVRVMAMGVKERFRVRGIDAVFYAETFQRGKELGYKEGELGWVLEDNLIMRQTIESIGGRLFKTYRFYIKSL